MMLYLNEKFSELLAKDFSSQEIDRILKLFNKVMREAVWDDPEAVLNDLREFADQAVDGRTGIRARFHNACDATARDFHLEDDDE
jgi:predicted component of type VI protein secretion system